MTKKEQLARFKFLEDLLTAYKNSNPNSPDVQSNYVIGRLLLIGLKWGEGLY